MPAAAVARCICRLQLQRLQRQLGLTLLSLPPQQQQAVSTQQHLRLLLPACWGLVAGLWAWACPAANHTRQSCPTAQPQQQQRLLRRLRLRRLQGMVVLGLVVQGWALLVGCLLGCCRPASCRCRG